VQKEVMLGLYAYISQYEYPPTVPELSKLVGRKNVGGEIKALKKKGWAETIEGQGIRSTILTAEAMSKLKSDKQTILNV
jgi:SOS-response transcriptional repressor LexA